MCKQLGSHQLSSIINCQSQGKRPKISERKWTWKTPPLWQRERTNLWLFFPSYATSLRFVAILSFATVCFDRGNLMTISDTDRDVWPILISVIQLLFRCSTSYACQPSSFSPCKVFWATKIGSNRRKSVTLSQIFQESGRLFLEARFKSGERLHMRFAITICRADNNRRNRADESSCLNPALHDMGRLAPSPPATSTVLVACQIQPNQVTRIKNARMLLP